MVFVITAVVGNITDWRWLLLFENFYRNGSLIFGGGQVFVPFLFSEFVELKHYLSSAEFLSGFACVQAMPGPIFSFSAYVGTLAMREYGLGQQIFGGLLAAAGMFLPGTFFVFFAIRFWEHLKKYRPIRAALEGIHAVGLGLLISAALTLFSPLQLDWENYVVALLTLCILYFTRINASLIIFMGILLGVFLSYF